MNKHLKRAPLYGGLAVILVFLIVWIGALVKCEILTARYRDDFQYAYQSNPMLDEMEYFKVLKCDGKCAEVYYVSENYTDANVLTFEKQNDVWNETQWKTIWSTSGSASEVIWPYWYHFVYGGL